MTIEKSQKQIQKFISIVYDYYHTHGRTFPWRNTRDPYKILVSEIMLQQTQADRVVLKYNSFIQKFPNLKHIARAPLSHVLAEWKGLGYNRRAKYLKSAAEEIVRHHGGIFPCDMHSLTALPGIGPATAGDIRAFAFNIPEIVIETNIRTVFIHHFFPEQEQNQKKTSPKVSDKELLPHIEATLDRNDPRSWYYALMDYGSMLKRTIGNVSRRSSVYTKQSAYAGSNRELRAHILFALSEKPRTTRALGVVCKNRTRIEIDASLTKLTNEGMIEKKNATWYIHGDAKPTRAHPIRKGI